ncbi:uncharacterized protein [Dysidea avara]|uniref:uncharacterized protein n=1 Tax=Dysidea avara TaxID=196820 RepID=UPI0033206E5F
MVPSNNIDTCRPSAVWINFNLNMLVCLASARHPKYRLQERRGGFHPTLRRVVIGRRPTKMVHQITLNADSTPPAAAGILKEINYIDEDSYMCVVIDLFQFTRR